MIRLTRSALGAPIALVLAMLWAAPVAAAQPTRTVFDLGSWVIPAGSGCAFDVEGQPSWGFIAKTVFSDGRAQYSVRAHGAYVNLATGARFATADTSRNIDQFDPATGIWVVSLSGQNSYNFIPGDIGPFGVVTNSDGAFYHIVGSVSYTFDTNTGHTIQFAYSGTVTDICAALS